MAYFYGMFNTDFTIEKHSQTIDFIDQIVYYELWHFIFYTTTSPGKLLVFRI